MAHTQIIVAITAGFAFVVAAFGAMVFALTRRPRKSQRQVSSTTILNRKSPYHE